MIIFFKKLRTLTAQGADPVKIVGEQTLGLGLRRSVKGTALGTNENLLELV